MNNTRYRRNTRNHYNPFENILNEMMNVPMKRIVNQKNIQFSYPAANIEEQEDRFILQLMLPGKSKKDIDIKMEKEELIISNINSEEPEEGKIPDFTLREFDYTKFERKFKLPNNILLHDIKAKLTKGILTITIPKDPNASRTISVG